MENRINIAQLLKDCPKGMELYSPMFGEIYLEGVKDTGRVILIEVSTSCNSIHQFYPDGKYNTYYSESECLLFPSKDQRDWSKFQRPFEDGDILATDLGSVFFLNTRLNSDERYGCYVGIGGDGSFHICAPFAYKECCGLATEEEKQKLFKAIKDNGYKWNAETKTLEKLIEPKFKVGDVIQDIDSYTVKITEVNVEDECYGYESMIAKGIGNIMFSKQDDWELVPNKFDITTLKPFESRVLVRDYDNRIWIPTFWGKRLEDDSNCSYLTTNGCYKYCIPYEGNEHLLGKTDDCDNFYKTWE